MGREVKRVPLDFNWPIGKIWPGYGFEGLCGIMENYHDGDCNLCKLFAKIIGLNMKNHECPEYNEKIEPPQGEGYQMWETTSEGSPMSPVFKTPEELARWLVDNNASSLGSQTATYEQWLAMIKDPGWAFSMVIEKGKIKSGVEYASQKNKKEDKWRQILQKTLSGMRKNQVIYFFPSTLNRLNVKA